MIKFENSVVNCQCLIVSHRDAIISNFFKYYTLLPVPHEEPSFVFYMLAVLWRHFFLVRKSFMKTLDWNIMPLFWNLELDHIASHSKSKIMEPKSLWWYSQKYCSSMFWFLVCTCYWQSVIHCSCFYWLERLSRCSCWFIYLPLVVEYDIASLSVWCSIWISCVYDDLWLH